MAELEEPAATGWAWKPPATAGNHEAKLRELLRNLCHVEVRICADASKEFRRLLDSDSGGEFLSFYARSSPNLAELGEAWRIHAGKPGITPILTLIASILGHSFTRKLKSFDVFARSIIEFKLDDIYVELKSGETKRQAACLSLLAAVSRRGPVLGSELGKKFMFGLPVMKKIYGLEVKSGRNRALRRAFVRFAVSFLESGSPRLLRWILQQKEMYSGVLCRIGSDEEETIALVLSVLKGRVLCRDSLVPPGLRSVLFGSVALEQLAYVSGNSDSGDASELAHEVLLAVCTDPANGLMPEGSLRGNVKRVSDFLMKLKATESLKHRELLLAVVRGRPALCSGYLADFPYHLEPRSSPQWFSSISLAADMVSSVNLPSSFSFLEALKRGDPPDLESKEVESVLKCIMPRSCNRLVVNKGLLHSDVLVQHGTLRLLLEALKLVDNLDNCMGCLLDRMRAKQSTEVSSVLDLSSMVDLLKPSKASEVYAGIGDDRKRSTSDAQLQKWVSFRGKIQDEVRSILPDPQVLLKLLASLTSGASKRSLDSPDAPRKKSKSVPSLDIDDVDIVVSVKDSGDIAEVIEDDVDAQKQRELAFSEIWGTSFEDMSKSENTGIFFHAKLVDALRFYLRALPLTLEGSFDFMKLLTSNPLTLSPTLQESVVSLLVEYTDQACDGQTTRPPPVMHKSLHVLIDLFLFSPNQTVRNTALTLVKRALMNTGAFDQNMSEIEAWLQFLPGYCDEKLSKENQGTLNLKGLYSVAISFFCEAVSTVSNNLYKYLDQLRTSIIELNEREDVSPDFSPLVICILQKCIRVLESDSRKFNLSERSMISLYVRNSISFILQTQVNLETLPGIIGLILKEKLDERHKSLCEWRPLSELLILSTNICQVQFFDPLASVEEKSGEGEMTTSFHTVLCKLDEVLNSNDDGCLFATSYAMCSAILCTNPGEVSKKLPLLAVVVHGLPTEHIQFLSFVLIQCGFLGNNAHLWSSMLPAFKDKALNEDFLEVDTNEKYTGFRLLMEHASFYDLFGGVVRSQICCSSNFSDLRAILSAKLEAALIGDWIAPLRFLLFWAYQIRLVYNKRPSSDLELMFELSTCFSKHILDKTIDQSSKGDILTAVTLILSHSVVVETILNPLGCDTSKVGSGGSLEFSSNHVHRMDIQILQVLKTAVELLSASITGSNPKVYSYVFEALTDLMERLVLSVRQIFDNLVVGGDFGSSFPSIYIFHQLSEFISPFKLMETVQWMLEKIEDNKSDLDPQKASLRFFFAIANTALEVLCNTLKNPSGRISSFLWGQISIKTSILRYLYRKFVEFAIRFKLDSVDSCLLKLVNIMYSQKLDRSVSLSAALPSAMMMGRIIIFSSMKLVIHCVYETSKTKARILFELIEISSLHRRLFHRVFLKLIKQSDSLGDDISIADVVWPAEIQIISANYIIRVSNSDLLLLLPASFSCINCTYRESRTRDVKFDKTILFVYSKILLKGLRDWKMFSYGTIFHEDIKLNAPDSLEEFYSCFHHTRLGKAVNMLHLSFICNVLPMKKRQLTEIFNVVFDGESSCDQLLDINMRDIDLFSDKDAFNIVNIALAKTYFALLLLFPPKSFTLYAKVKFEKLSEKTSSSRNSARLRFLEILVLSLNNLVNKFSYNAEGNMNRYIEKTFRFFEVHILGIIVQLSLDMKNVLTQLPAPFLLPFVRASFLHRFDDPTTIRAVRILAVNLVTSSSALEILELLLGHSKFINYILWNGCNVDVPDYTSSGASLQPLPSIFNLVDGIDVKVDDLSPEITGKDKCLFMSKLELIKLLRVLFYLKDPQEKAGVDSSELLSLLLSGYGATHSQLDLQVLHLMREIESIGEVSIASMDYLWGNSAVEIRREKRSTLETEDERRQRVFKENIPLDSKRCMRTALNFCHDRAELTELISLKSLLLESSMDLELSSSNFWDISPTYDPGFLLPFSIHFLRRRYIEPVEFVRLGLLAIVLVSISSADEDIRRMGYEALGIFKAVLEGFKTNRDILQLRLLLAYLQNGIAEECEKISSLTAMFAAEASFILLDPSHYCFQAISKFLMESPKADFKELPLFHLTLASHSIHFKANFSWILKLLYAGVNFEDDARIVERKHLFELLMSLYVSSLSDPETKALILQVMKKSSKLSAPANVLVKYHGLIPWIASVIKLNAERLPGDQKIISMRQIESALEVIKNVVSWRPISEWLKDSGFEQLSNLSQVLLHILVDSLALLNDKAGCVNSILSIVISTLEMSQERDVSKSHLIFCMDALLRLCHALGLVSSRPMVHLGLTVILMSTPPPVRSRKDKSELLEVSIWALAACQQYETEKSGPTKTTLCDDDDDDIPLGKEAFLAKVLRWISASIILGCVLDKNDREKGGESLQTFLGKIKYLEDDDLHTNKALAVFIIHLWLLVGTECRSLSSTLSALSILLHPCIQSGESSDIISSLCQKIRYPTETSSSWMWCSRGPPRYLSSERAPLQELEEEQSCEALLLFFSNVSGPEPESDIQLYREVEDSNLFEWEKSLLQKTDP